MEKLEKIQEKINDDITNEIKKSSRSSLMDDLLSSKESIQIASDELEDVPYDPEIKEEEEEKGITIENNTSEESKSESKKDDSDTENVSVFDERQAEGFVFFLDLVTSKICTAIAQEDDDKKYRLKPEDYKRSVRVTKDYFKTVDVNLSPTQLFIFTMLTIFGGNVVSASFTRLKKRKNEKKKQQELLSNLAHRKKQREEEEQLKLNNIAYQNAQVESNTEIKEVKKPQKRRTIKRGNFDIDELDRYKYTESRDYVKGGQDSKRKLAPSYVVQLKKEGKTNKEIKWLLEHKKDEL